jgi:hypothetical protein
VEQKKYARKYLRINPDQPMFGTASIVQVGLKRVYTGSARVRILNLSPGGLRFVSSLSLPADNRVILEICFKLDGLDYCLKGCVAYSNCTEVSEYEYGFRFLEPAENLREALKKLFGRMYVMSNRHIVILKLK